MKKKERLFKLTEKDFKFQYVRGSGPDRKEIKLLMLAFVLMLLAKLKALPKIIESNTEISP